MTNMHNNSLLAYYTDVLKGTKHINEAKIYLYLEKNRSGASRQTLSKVLNLPINVICGRVNGLMKVHAIKESGNEHVKGKQRAILVIT